MTKYNQATQDGATTKAFRDGIRFAVRLLAANSAADEPLTDEMIARLGTYHNSMTVDEVVVVIAEERARFEDEG